MKRRNFLLTSLTCLLVGNQKTNASQHYYNSSHSNETNIACILYFGFVAKILCDIQMSNVNFDLTKCKPFIYEDLHCRKFHRIGLYSWLEIPNQSRLSYAIDWQIEKLPNFSVTQCIEVWNWLIKYELPNIDINKDYNHYSNKALKLVDELSL